MLGLGNNITTSGGSFEVIPTDISNIAFWYKNGEGVTAAKWTDSSGQGNHMQQSTSGNQASVSDGGLLFVDDNSDHYDLDSAVNIGGENAFTMAIVMKLNSYDTQNTILGDNNQTDRFLEFQQTSQMRYRQVGSTSVIKFGGTEHFPINTKYSIIFTKATDRTLAVWKNGSELTQSGTTNNPAISGDFSVDQIGGRSAAPDRDFDGYIYELILYTKKLSDAEIGDLHGYLSGIHGL